MFNNPEQPVKHHQYSIVVVVFFIPFVSYFITVVFSFDIAFIRIIHSVCVVLYNFFILYACALRLAMDV